MLSRVTTLIIAGLLYHDWKGMPVEWIPSIIGGAIALGIIDVLIGGSNDS